MEVFSQKNRRYRSVPDDNGDIKIINPIKENVNHLLTLENILANNEENQTDVYPIDLVQVESLQRRDRNLRRTMANDPERNYKRKTFEQRSIIFYKDRIVIPEPLRVPTIRWYHHYLCHPGKHACIRP